MLTPNRTRTKFVATPALAIALATSESILKLGVVGIATGKRAPRA